MTNLYTKTRTELTTDTTNFGFRDRQGRSVGYAYRIFQVVYTPSSNSWGYRLPEGFPVEHLEVAGYPTRDGAHYGASTSNIPVLTQDEAAKVIKKRTENARKRDTKKFCGE